MNLEMLSNSARTVVGVKQTLRVINSEKAKNVFIAGDADKHVTEAIITACEKQGLEYKVVLTMHELGKACGILSGLLQPQS